MQTKASDSMPLPGRPFMSNLSICVIVPSYRRPEALRRCLDGLSDQDRLPDQVTVVVRADDSATLALVARLDTRPTLLTVSEPGQVYALAAGLRSASTDIVAFTDDDAVPRRDWISRMLAHFSDGSVGGVGGRDVVPSAEGEPLCERVGTVNSWGRVVGNHHVGTGEARRVDVLKGVNMAFRRPLVRFPDGLRGGGAQAHNDLALSLWVRSQGWDLVYDPNLLVDHYPAPRHAGTPRGRPPTRAVSDEAFNLTAALLASGKVAPSRLFVYGLMVGDRSYPGPVRCLIGLSQPERVELLRRMIPSLQGKLAAYRSYRAGVRLGYDLPDSSECRQYSWWDMETS